MIIMFYEEGFNLFHSIFRCDYFVIVEVPGIESNDTTYHNEFT